jgi:hypothetical protein
MSTIRDTEAIWLARRDDEAPVALLPPCSILVDDGEGSHVRELAECDAARLAITVMIAEHLRDDQRGVICEALDGMGLEG